MKNAYKTPLDKAVEDVGPPPDVVVVCICVVPDIQLRVIPHTEVQPLGYVINSGKIGEEGVFWLISNSDPVHAKSPADLAATATFQATGIALDPSRFVLDNRWMRSSIQVSGFSYWESLYFVDITQSEKERIIPNNSENRKLAVIDQDSLQSMLSYADRGHFLRLRYSRRFATQKLAA